MTNYSMLINGELVDSDNSFDVINPATAASFAAAPDATRVQLDQAVAAANAAFPAWAALDMDERRKCLRALGEAIQGQRDKLAEVLMREQGKCLADAKGEVSASAQYIEAICNIDLPMRETRDAPNATVELRRKPLGVVGAITPWNYPLLLAIWKLSQAMLVGYGLGGVMAVYFVKEGGAVSEVDAIVAISLSVPDSEQQQVQVVDFIGDIKQPFLDIFAEFDLPEVTDSARKRRIAGKMSSAYRQFKIEGEGHLFQHDEGLLVKRVYSWINRAFRKPR